MNDTAALPHWMAHRPAYHFAPPQNWMNDPNGTIYHNGHYHLFYQHYPYGAYWADMHWGHASSRDLLRWTHLPIALTPTPGGPDKDGCFSGCAVVNGGVPTLIYTGVSPEVQCLATSDSEMISWAKHPANPVIAAPPDGMEVTGFRDPCVWQEGGLWHMLIGSGIKDVGPAALLYTSPDLVQWTYRHPLLVGDPNETSAMWECPDFFPLGGKHVLLVSPLHTGRVFYFVGRYAGGEFHPETPALPCDPGSHFYAPKSLLDGQKRRLLWGWLTEGWSVESQKAAGYSGALSLPRVLTLRKDNTLGQAPAPELEDLRHVHRRIEHVPITPDTPGDLTAVAEAFTPHMELRAVLDIGEAAEVGLRLRRAPDGGEETLLFYRRADSALHLDRARSSFREDASRAPESGPFPRRTGEPLELRVFLDESVIEVFANDRACLTSRVYPTDGEAVGVGLYARGGDAWLKSLDVWAMRPLETD